MHIHNLPLPNHGLYFGIQQLNSKGNSLVIELLHLNYLFELVLLEAQDAVILLELLYAKKWMEQKGVISARKAVEVTQKGAAYKTAVVEQSQQIVAFLVVKGQTLPARTEVVGEASQIVSPSGKQLHHMHCDSTVVIDRL